MLSEFCRLSGGHIGSRLINPRGREVEDVELVLVNTNRSISVAPRILWKAPEEIKDFFPKLDEWFSKAGKKNERID